MQKRVTLWAALLIIAALVLTGCAPRAGAGASAAMASDDELTIDLPAIVIDFDSDGSASVGGMPISDLGATAGIDLSTVALPAEWVQYFTTSNIQHMQVNNGADGLTLMVNGQPVPSLVWDEGSLVATADTVSALGVAVPTLNKVLPLVQQLGLGVILRFPVAADEDLIPMVVEGDGSMAESAKMAQEEFLAAVGSPPRINLPVVYEEDGSWSVGDLTDTEWTALTGAPFYALRLDPALLNGLAASGVNSMSFETEQEGIHISINGNPLPYLSWGSGEVQHVLALSQQMGLLQAAMPGMDMEAVLGTVESLLPVIQTSDANITIYLPGSGMGN